MPFIKELRRRNVIRVAIAYAILTWILIEVTSTTFPILNLPEWTVTLVTVLLLIGFPVALILAWAFELTPEGIKLEKDVVRTDSITHVTGRKLDFIIIGVLVIGIAFLLADKFYLTETSKPGDGEIVATDPSIAVLPFDNRSAAAENAEFFAAGLHDELLTLLSKIGDLKVISRTSVERLDSTLSVPEISVLLGVATVLEGQVQRAGDRLRINAQLINARTEDHIWANTYDRELTAENIFDVQSDIARTIADALQTQLSPSDEALLNAVPTENTEALSRYLLGRQLKKRSSFESLEQAGRYFSEATELDPEYAEAWTAIADNYGNMLLTGQIGEREYIAGAEPAIMRALSLDDRLPEAHAQLAALRWHSGDADAAEVAFKKALDLSPNDSRSLLEFGRYLRINGRPEETISILEPALGNDPLSVELLFELGKAEMYLGRPEKNVTYGKQILEIDPASVYGYTAVVQAYDWMGRYDLKWPWFFKAMSTDPDDFEFWAAAAIDMSDLGATDWADLYMDRALALGPDEPVPLRAHAQLLARRGDQVRALEIARRALEAGLHDRWGSNDDFLRLVRDDALQTGDHDEARDWYRDHHPGLFAESPEITVGNVNAAADLALLLQRAGDVDTADLLINAGLRWYRQSQPPGVHGFLTSVVDVELLALKGEKEAALDTLRDAVASGWRAGWRWILANENFSSLKGAPEYQAIVASLENDMATQLEVLKVLPYQGETDLRFAQDK